MAMKSLSLFKNPASGDARFGLILICLLECSNMLQRAVNSATATGLVSGEGDMKMEKGPEGQQMFVLWRPPYNDGLLDVPSNREPKWWFPNHLLGPGKSPMMGSDNPVISVSRTIKNSSL